MEKYEVPELEIIRLESEDVITTSGDLSDDDDDWFGEDVFED